MTVRILLFPEYIVYRGRISMKIVATRYDFMVSNL